MRLETGIYQDRIGFAAVVFVGNSREEQRFPADTPRVEMRAWRAEAETRLRRIAGATAPGTVQRDVADYLKTVTYLASVKSRRSELGAWVALYGPRQSSSLTPSDVRWAIAKWTQHGKSPKTIKNRLVAFGTMHRAIYGKRTPTPVDDIAAPQAPQTIPQDIPPRVIRRVALILLRHERKGWLRTAKTRARFMVLASTGKRPSDLKRAQPGDVDLDRRVWRVRTGKGGYGPPLYLNDDTIAAWDVFIAAGAWGHFDTRSFERRVYKARWPRRYRLYNLRHAVGIAYSESGTDLADVQLLMGHTSIRTTRHFYVPANDARLMAAVKAIDGRLGWRATVGATATAKDGQRLREIRPPDPPAPVQQKRRTR